MRERSGERASGRESVGKGERKGECVRGRECEKRESEIGRVSVCERCERGRVCVRGGESERKSV